MILNEKEKTVKSSRLTNEEYPPVLGYKPLIPKQDKTYQIAKRKSICKRLEYQIDIWLVIT